MKIVAYDTTEKGWFAFGIPGLTYAWWAGSYLLSGADEVVPVGSTLELVRRVSSLIAKAKYENRRIDFQLWGHGFQGAPVVNGVPVTPADVEKMMTKALPGSTAWWRSCLTHEGEDGAKFAKAIAALGITSIGHCAITNKPNPLYQREICALRPGEPVWWSQSGHELGQVHTLAMTPPPWAFRPPAREAA